VQADRGARPNQTPFLAGEGADREAYLAAEPAQDARFAANFAHALEHAGGYEPQRALAVARSLLPDVLPHNPKRPAAYPNGRALTDDVSDVFLSLFTDGKVRGDNVGPHTDLLNEFRTWARRTTPNRRWERLRSSGIGQLTDEERTLRRPRVGKAQVAGFAGQFYRAKQTSVTEDTTRREERRSDEHTPEPLPRERGCDSRGDRPAHGRGSSSAQEEGRHQRSSNPRGGQTSTVLQSKRSWG
jgi:hypothetical protein